MSSPDVAIVLPPKEGFAEDAVGAIGLLVQRLCRAGAGGVVFGRPNATPTFPGIEFRAVRPAWGFSRAGRYAAGVAKGVRAMNPALIEVHNWPEVALRLCGRGTPVTLILNNDPHSMRGARTQAQRRHLLARLAGVATSSEWLRGRLGEAPGTPPVTILPNCIDVPYIYSTEREQLILFAGRIVADKGADTFVEACARALPELPGWRADMIGADRFRPDSPETPFTHQVRLAAAAAGVTMHGHRPNPAVTAAMQRAAIVVVPSRWAEPFGIVALEALGAGAALICSPRGGLPEVAGPAALYVDPERPGALAEAILRLARNPQSRAALAQAGHARAGYFDSAAAAQRLSAFRSRALAVS